MTDTTPEIEQMQFEMMTRLGPSRRIALACEMYAAARTAILRSIPKELSEDSRRRIFVDRMYGTAFADSFFKDEYDEV